MGEAKGDGRKAAVVVPHSTFPVCKVVVASPRVQEKWRRWQVVLLVIFGVNHLRGARRHTIQHFTSPFSHSSEIRHAVGVRN